MRLKEIIALKQEVKHCLVQFENDYKILYFESMKELESYIRSKVLKKTKEDLLLVASTDEIVALGQQYEIATLAYCNPDFKGQRLEGVLYLVENFDGIEARFLERVYQRYYHLPWLIAKTKRCIIRELSLADLRELFQLYEDKDLVEYTEDLFSYEEELEYQRAYIQNMYRYFGYGMWLVFLKDSGELIGRAGLEHREVSGETEVELGYLIKKKYQNQGLATEVCQAIIDIAREELEIERLHCFIQEGNTPSTRIAEKLGFQFCECIVENGRKMLRFVKK